MSSTRDRILDTAEVCFAQRGFDGTSLREITRLAGVNLGAVNYHFGSKSALFSEVLRRRFDPMNQRRVELLDRVLERHALDEAPLEEMLEAFIRPPAEAFSSPARATLLTMMHAVNAGEIDPEEFAHLFENVHRRFAVMRERLAPMPDLEFQGRVRFLVGGMVHILADRTWTGSELASETVIQMLVQWGAAALRTPAVLQPEASGEQSS